MSSAALAKEEGRKLHPSSSAPQITQGQASGATSSAVALRAMAGQASKSSLEFGEDVPASLHYAVARKKRLRLLSEELLLAQKREEKTYVFVRHFFGQKNGGWNFYLSPAILKRFLRRKTQNLAVK